MQKVFSQINSWQYTFIALLISFISALYRFYALSKTSYVNGWDGYFYVVQMQSWIEEGSPHTGDASLIYLYLSSFAFIFPYELAYKIALAVLVGLFTLMMIKLAQQWTNAQKAILVGVCVSASPHLTYFVAQYPKNLFGAFFLLVFWLVFSIGVKKITQNKLHRYEKIGYLSLITITLILNYFGHKLTFLFAFTWLCIYGLVYFKKIRLLWIGVVILTIISWLQLDFSSYWSQWRRIHESLGSFSFGLWEFYQSFGKERISIFWQIELLFAIVIVLISLFSILQVRVNTHKSDYFLKTTSLCISLLLIPILKWDLEGISFRLVMLFGVLWIVLIQNVSIPQAIQSYVVFFIGLVSPFSSQSYKPLLHDPPNQSYQAATNQFINLKEAKYTKLAIIHKSFAEYFTFHTRIDALPWLPEYEIYKDSLYRITSQIRKEEFDFYIPDKTTRLSLDYFLLKESDWQLMHSYAQQQADSSLLYRMNEHTYNPSRVRPQFLLNQKNKP